MRKLVAKSCESFDSGICNYIEMEYVGMRSLRSFVVANDFTISRQFYKIDSKDESV